MSSEPRLPQLSSLAWTAILLAGLVTLVLGVYPVVAYPSVARVLAQRPVGTLAGVLVTRPLAWVFALATAGLLLAAVTGQRSSRLRTRLAYASFAIASAGLCALITGLYGLKNG